LVSFLAIAAIFKVFDSWMEAIRSETIV
jgi:hypothetical protein